MVSQKVLDYLASKYGENNYAIRLQDFSDGDVRKAIESCKPSDWFDIENYLYEKADDEVRAHLKGFDSASERQEAIQHVRNLQKRIKEIEERL